MRLNASILNGRRKKCYMTNLLQKYIDGIGVTEQQLIELTRIDSSSLHEFLDDIKRSAADELLYYAFSEENTSALINALHLSRTEFDGLFDGEISENDCQTMIESRKNAVSSIRI